MIEVKIDKTAIRSLAIDFSKQQTAAMTSALRSESYRLNQQIREYARSQGNGKWRYAPITKYLRKGRGYGQWLAKFVRYYVNPQAAGGQVAYAGLLDKRDIMAGGARFTPISSSFAGSAHRHATGFRMYISGRQQRRMAARLLAPTARHFTKMKTLRGAQRKYDAIHAAIPKAGWRRVAARPFIEPVVRAERDRSVRNITALYLTKMAGARYGKDWAREWGNS